MRALALLVLTAAPALSAQTFTMACGKLFDAEHARLLGPHVIGIRDGRIATLTPGTGPADIDHSAHTCLPGLIDLHVHLSAVESGPASYTDPLRLNPGDFALRAAASARKTLRAGFTSVRDLGDIEGAVLALRNAINEGIAEGPRIYAAGKAIATSGGHADPSNGLNRRLAGEPGPREGVINGPGEAAAAVRRRYQEGSDLIKITATGGVLSYAKNGLNPQFTQAEAEAIVATAKDYGFPVAAHAHGVEGMRRAILAGVTSIEHGTFMDEPTMQLMKERGTWLVPTLLAGWFTAERAQTPGYYPPMVAAKAKAIGPKIKDTFGKAFAAGVRIAFGTDSGVSPHGMNAKEFELMVEAGMPAAQAIQAATFNAAQVLGVPEEIGSLSAGHHADVVVVAGDPLSDIRLLQKPLVTYKAGVAYPAN